MLPKLLKSQVVLVTILVEFVVLLLVINSVQSQQPPSLYSCINWECEEWISKGKTLIRYIGKTKRHLSFKPNEDIYIVSKPVDPGVTDWVGKVGSKVGLVPKDMVKEEKLNKNPVRFKVDLQEILAYSLGQADGLEVEDDEADAQQESLDAAADVKIEDVDEDNNLGEGNGNDKVEASVNVPTTPSTSDVDQTSVTHEEKLNVESATTVVAATPSTFIENLERDTVVTSFHSYASSGELNLSLESVPGGGDEDDEGEVAEEKITSDSVLDSINLQPSTDTVLQSTSPSTIEYLPETPKTSVEHISQDSTPRIPETVVLSSFNSIQSSASFKDQASVDVSELSASKVEKSSINQEEETQFTVPVEEQTRELPENISTITLDEASSFNKTVENINEEVDPQRVEPVNPNKLPEIPIQEPPQPPSEPPVQTFQEVVTPPPALPETSTLVNSESLPEPQLSEEPNLQLKENVTENIDESSKDIPEPVKDADSAVTTEKPEDASTHELEHVDISPPEKSPEESIPVQDTPSEPTLQPPEEVPLEAIPVIQQTEEHPTLPPPPPEENITPEPPPLESLSAPESSSHENDSNVMFEAFKEEPSIPIIPRNTEEEAPPPAQNEEVISETPSPSISVEPHVEEQIDSINVEPSASVVASPPEEPVVETTEQPEPHQPQEIVDQQLESQQELEQPPPTTEPPIALRSEEIPPSFTTVAPATTWEAEPVGNKEPQEPEPVVPLTPEDPELTQSQEKEDEHQHDDHHNEHDHHSHHNDNQQNDDHDHHHHHHRHHHRHSHDLFKDSNETSSLVLVIKHLSSTLLSFLPEPLQDTILDVDDALVFTGIIALTLVSICVPYFLIEGYMSVRPLKKKVVELNKSLWKVSAAYETQQEEFEIFKQKAFSHDEFKRRAEQSENDVIILKKLETKHREQITGLKIQLKKEMKEAMDIRAMIEKTLEDKKLVVEECAKYKSAYENTKDALVRTKEELSSIQTHTKSTALQLGMSSKNAEVLTSKISLLSEEVDELKSQLVSENDKRKQVEKEKQEVESAKGSIEKELGEIKTICKKYEETVGGLNDEISRLESELISIKESLGEDSPLLEVAEVQAKAQFAEREAESLRTRLDGLRADNENLTGRLKKTEGELEEVKEEREEKGRRLQVLEGYFKEREEEYVRTIERLQLKESVRDKGKEELIKMIEEKEEWGRDLEERLEKLREEYEETKQQHRNEIRVQESKSHENWLSLCQAERKAQDARKEAELLRQRLTALSKEKDDDEDGLNGDGSLFPVIPHELVPLPIEEPPSYFGLDDFIPPPPLPDGEDGPHRPPPLGGRLSPPYSDLDDNILSPIGVVGRRREDECTDGSSGSEQDLPSPPLRGGWVNVQQHQNNQNNRASGQGRETIRNFTSSPIQPGANL